MGLVELSKEEASGMHNNVFQTLFENSSDAMLLLAGDQISDCNPAALKLMHCTKEALTNLPSEQISPERQPDGSLSQERSAEMVRLAYEKGSHTFEWLYCRPAGDSFDAEVNLTPVAYGERPVVLAVLRDISARKQTEQALKQSEELYHTLFDSQQDGVFLIQNAKIVAANHTTARMTGYTQEEMTGLPFIEMIAPDYKALVTQNYRDRLAGLPIPEEYEIHLLHKDQVTQVPVMLTAHSGVYRGNPVVMGTVRNLTEKLRVEAALRESQQRLEMVFNNSPVVMSVIDSDGIFTLSEGQGLADLGLKPGQVVGRSVFDVYHDSPDVLEIVRRALRGERFQSVAQVGSLWFESIYAPLLDDQGQFIGSIGLSTNVTSRMKAAEDRERLVSILEATTDFVGTADLAGQALYMNKAGRVMLGLPLEGSLEGKNIANLQPAWSVDLLNREAFPQALKTGSWTGEAALLSADGQEIPVLQTVMVHYNPNGEAQFYSTIARDISERKQFEQQLQEMLLRRGYQVQVSTEIAQEIAAARALDDLFARVVTLVKERFGYYHTQILRFDPALNAVVLVSGYGETGQRMLAGHHRMELGRGLIGVAAATAQTVLRTNTFADPDWRPNPLLPDTRGEIAVPIKYGDRLLGVLDVQSDRPDALTDDDRLMLEGLCGQIAIAIEGTTLRQGLEERLNELNALYRATSQEGWRSFRSSLDTPTGFVYDQVETHVKNDIWVDEIEKAVQENQPVAAGSADSAAVAPLSVRGEVIGALGIFEDPKRPLSEQEMELIEQVTDQVALALESARLFEQTRLALGETEEQAQHLASLNDMSELLNKAGDALEAMAIACEKTREIFQGNNCGVAMIDPGGNTFDIYALVGPQTVLPQSVHLPIAGTAIGLAMVENRVILLPQDGALEDYPDARIQLSEGMLSGLTAPLVVGQQVVGSLYLMSRKPNNFEDRDRNLIAQLASTLSSTLENRRLFERIQNALIATEKQYNYTRRLSEAHDLQEILISTVEAFGVSDINRAILYSFRFDQESELVGVTVKANWYSGQGPLPFPVGMSETPKIVNKIFSRMRVETPLFITATDEEDRQQEIMSAAVLPLWVGNRQLGVIALQSDVPHTFTDEEKNPAASLAQQAAIAIESRLLFEEIENQRRTLQAVLDNMPAGVYMVGAPTGRPLLTNKRAEEFLGAGISPNASGEDVKNVYPRYKYGTNELYPNEQMPLTLGMMGETRTISDMEVRKPDGTTLLLEVTGAPVYDNNGVIIASVVVVTDVTERRRLEATILQERTQLAGALNAARMANWEFDVTTGNFIFNDRFYEFLGTTAEAEGGYIMPAPVFASKFVPPEDAAIVAQYVQEAIETSDPNFHKEGLSRQRLANGEIRDIIVRFEIEKDAQGRTIRTFGANQDVTEQRRAEATIAKRAAELATVSQISTTVATILNPEDMLQTVVDLTRTSFNLYHAHVYLMNDQNSELVLAKGSGEVGRRMVAEGRTIAVNHEKSLVARAGRTRQGVIVNDTRQDPEFLPHPLLPDTRSEMAVPLVVGDAILGVMDVQSDEINRFSQEDISILTTLGAQVAVSLQNARSYARAQRQAEREALINAISERIQSTNSVEAALQVAVRELGRALGAQHTAIRLGLERKGSGQ